MWKEFREFAMRGNMVDLAVGIILGVAFGTIVSSLVADVIMPPIGLLLGKVDFSNMFIVLREGAKAAGPYTSLASAKAAGAVSINYGVFINAIVNFIIVALAVFVLVRTINRARQRTEARKEAAAPVTPTTKDCPYCFSKININASRCPNCTSQLQAAGNR